MNKNTSSSPLDGITFEDIMSEEAIVSEKTTRGTHSSDSDYRPRRNSASSDSSVNFSIVKNYGRLSNRKNAAAFALVDWNGYNRYDLRSWSDDFSVPYKGITFTDEEIPELLTALSQYSASSGGRPRYTYSAGKANATIYDCLCTLSSSTTRGVTWNKQVNIVAWGRGQKFDFRKWTADYSKCSKGISLSREEVSALCEILENL